ncbi:hypothetical protein BH10CHL1_BH10CHL1_22540 [soil metagenome]
MAKKDDDHATNLAIQADRNQQYLIQLRAHRAVEEAVSEAAKAVQQDPATQSPKRYIAKLMFLRLDAEASAIVSRASDCQRVNCLR